VKTQLTKVSATMVEDSAAGDAITLQLCSDLQTTDCCSLAPITEFKANQTVVLETDKFADCKDKVFTVSASFSSIESCLPNNQRLSMS
jgi:hypothetical protein